MTRERKLLRIAEQVFGELAIGPQTKLIGKLKQELLRLYPRAKLRTPPPDREPRVPAEPDFQVPVPTLLEIETICDGSTWERER